jgi:uncharacterized protein (TIGR02147 family)
MPLLQKVIRNVLVKEFETIRKLNSSYSLRAYAKKLNLAGPELSSFINKKRNFSITKTMSILDKTKLSDRKKDKLKKFIGDYREAYSIYSCKGMYSKINDHSFSDIKDWYFYVILCLLELNEGGCSLEFIESKLEIEKERVVFALETLINLELVKKECERYYFLGNHLTTTKKIKSESLRDHHKQNIFQALNAIEAYPTDLRSISGNTFNIDKNRLPEAFDMIDNFRQFFACYFSNEDSDSVYRLNLQLFPMILDGVEKEEVQE